MVACVRRIFMRFERKRKGVSETDRQTDNERERERERKKEREGGERGRERERERERERGGEREKERESDLSLPLEHQILLRIKQKKEASQHFIKSRLLHHLIGLSLSMFGILFNIYKHGCNMLFTD